MEIYLCQTIYSIVIAMYILPYLNIYQFGDGSIYDFYRIKYKLSYLNEVYTTFIEGGIYPFLVGIYILFLLVSGIFFSQYNIYGGEVYTFFCELYTSLLDYLMHNVQIKVYTTSSE
jgi:hypothetical protein